MLLILQDALRHPGAFDWFGSIRPPALAEWLRRSGFVIPRDLQDFWIATGGGDVFESETLLRPTGMAAKSGEFFAGDDIETANERHRQRGLTAGLLLFHQGTWNSAIALDEQRYAVLNSEYSELFRFDSFDDWYAATIRKEFGERYGLSATTQPR